MTVYIIISSIVALLIGGLLTWLSMRFLLKSRYDSVLREAEKEAEVIKKNKLLEVKEKFLHLKADLEKQVSARNAKIQSAEGKLKQRELTLNQRQEDLQRKNCEIDAVKENLATQLELVDRKKQDLEKLHQREIEHLEALSGLSADEAKERLIESLKDEAKSEATSYINEIMEEAKMTANKEAKKIVIQSIQRVATETAIENSITVFHIESDEIKGRIIGREGRNIRALEAATGIEIVVDDTPEAIVLSGFDPVRREIARLALHQLVQDGRIHPARIEEVVTKVKKQVEDEVVETGKRTVIDLGVHGLHPELIRMIHREIEHVKLGRKGRIVLKMNGLHDQNMINELYHASENGVEIDLIVRGICCLVPGQPYSANIRITRIVDMFLEHSRIWYFYNDGKEDVYLTSADWMRRNLNRRIETAFPILVPEIKQEVIDILKIQMRDNVKACLIDEQLHNNFKHNEEPVKVRSQLAIYEYLKNKS